MRTATSAGSNDTLALGSATSIKCAVLQVVNDLWLGADHGTNDATRDPGGKRRLNPSRLFLGGWTMPTKLLPHTCGKSEKDSSGDPPPNEVAYVNYSESNKVVMSIIHM